MPINKRHFVAIGLLWLSGISLRCTVLAVPPLLPLMIPELVLSGTEIGILAGLPIAFFAITALPGSQLISRFGSMPTLIVGLLTAALAGALRGASPSVAFLYFTTILMGAGISICQPAIPALVREWLPSRVAFGTATFTVGMICGTILPVYLTSMSILSLLSGSWRWTLVVWSIPLVATVLALCLSSPAMQGSIRPHSTPRRLWSFNWKSSLIWRIGLIFGSINSLYFGANAFIPGYFAGTTNPDFIGNVLLAFNLGQLPSSLFVLSASRSLERRSWPFILAGIILLIGLAGIVSTASAWTILWAGMLGVGGGLSLTLGLTLPTLLVTPSEVAQTSAAMFTISYSMAMLISAISGATWDFTGIPLYAFLPIAVGVLPLVLLTPSLFATSPAQMAS